MEPLQLPELELSAKAKEVFARCVAEIERVNTPLDDQDVVRLSSVASQLNSVAVSEGNSHRRPLGLIAGRIKLISGQCQALRRLETEHMLCSHVLRTQGHAPRPPTRLGIVLSRMLGLPNVYY